MRSFTEMFETSEAVFELTKHKELWLWLAENSGADKKDWPGWKEYGHVAHLCYACDYAKNVVTLIGAICAYNCTYCPFDNYGKMHDACLDGLFTLWSIVRKGYLDSRHRHLRDTTSEYAKRIALLTPREGVKII